jgi:RNA polymerase sigma-70 factor, ECF subfamily
MTCDAKAGEQRAQRFRDAALPYIDDAYTLAQFLMCDQANAEDAVQVCYSHALRHFDSFRGPAMKTWLLAILRRLCHAKLARRSRPNRSTELPDSGLRQLIVALPLPLREVVVLRELIDLSYQEIAELVGAPVGTVMSRLARARAMLVETTDSAAWWQPKNPLRGATRMHECANITMAPH